MGLPASLILHGGSVLTVDSKNSVSNAVAVWRNRIAAVGRDGVVVYER